MVEAGHFFVLLMQGGSVVRAGCYVFAEINNFTVLDHFRVAEVFREMTARRAQHYSLCPVYVLNSVLLRLI
jgi:hypothetical protein